MDEEVTRIPESPSSSSVDRSSITALEKSSSPLRWPVLVLACLMLVGSYYAFDIPAALKTQIDSYFNDPDYYESYFSLLYTLYSIPNVIIPFFGGYLVDLLGVRICLTVFAGLITVGQLIFTFGVQWKSWPVMFLGRVVFGLGGESFVVANTALLADWFKGKELAFSFGINLAIARLGSVFNNIISPRLGGVVYPNYFGFLLCCLSFLCVLITLPIDRSIEMKIKLYKNSDMSIDSDIQTPERKEKSINRINDSNEVNDTSPKIKDLLKFPFVFWILVVLCITVYGCITPFNNVASSFLLERDYFIQPNSCELQNNNECQSPTNVPINCPTRTKSQWYQPPLPSNYTSIVISEIDCALEEYAEASSCTYYYCEALLNAEKEAGIIMSIPYIISASISPLVGFLVDQYGFRAVIATLAPIAIVVVHSLLGYSKINPIIPLVGQGLAYTGFAAVLWPSIPLVIEERYIGLAFGVLTSVLNIGSAAIPPIVAYINTKSNHKYIPHVEIMFICMGLFGFFVGLLLNYVDYFKLDSVLNRGLQSTAADKDGDYKERLLSNDRVGESWRSLSSQGEDEVNNEIHQRKGSFTSYGEVVRKL